MTVGTPIKYPSIPNSPSHSEAQGITLFYLLQNFQSFQQQIELVHKKLNLFQKFHYFSTTKSGSVFDSCISSLLSKENKGTPPTVANLLTGTIVSPCPPKTIQFTS